MTDREAHLVELVDSFGVAIGESTVDIAHQAPGLLHRAFSVVLTDPAGRILLQQRAEVKTRFPLRWANACCGHPEPGGSLLAAATRRLAEELGLDPVPLTEVGVYQYFAEDPATGRVEREYDHVLLGALESGHGLRPAPDEVADLRWIQPDDLVRDLELRPEAYAPWLSGVVARVVSPSDVYPPIIDPPIPGPASRPAGGSPPVDGSASPPVAGLASPPVAGSAASAVERSGGR